MASLVPRGSMFLASTPFITSKSVRVIRVSHYVRALPISHYGCYLILGYVFAEWSISSLVVRSSLYTIYLQKVLKPVFRPRDKSIYTKDIQRPNQLDIGGPLGFWSMFKTKNVMQSPNIPTNKVTNSNI